MIHLTQDQLVQIQHGLRLLANSQATTSSAGLAGVEAAERNLALIEQLRVDFQRAPDTASIPPTPVTTEPAEDLSGAVQDAMLHLPDADAAWEAGCKLFQIAYAQLTPDQRRAFAADAYVVAHLTPPAAAPAASVTSEARS